MQSLRKDYPWIRGLLICCAPMRMIATAPLVAATTKAGGFGFLGAGSDTSTLESDIEKTQDLLSKETLPTASSTLPFGIGLLLWGLSIPSVTSILSKPGHRPAAVWLFAPKFPSDLGPWTEAIRKATDNKSKIWIQVGTVAEAVSAVRDASPDVLVVQGQDAGGHGQNRGAGLLPLLPEVIAAVRGVAADREPAYIGAGGIMDGQCAAAAVTLGAHGVCLGTRLLATPEANISDGYRAAVVRAKDGGATTVRTHVYDHCRGITSWPDRYGGRGVVNASYKDHEEGMDMQENKKLYDQAVEKGDEGWHEDHGRMTTYAGTGVGLVSELKPAAEVVAEIREEMGTALKRAVDRLKELEG
ncbi:inosine monophosphate dehydrogenase [Myriangium duriaei CBS 260.36]|uniref:Inosine monophosphate dehydrogenase n=1 Tax=Myriangium duriaei CBS 260.36 TaxID=1168546 RepID=A0A9P4IX33_9PEZI|nr:inosine monophosphate dehydrogenase [Myriangium duriaei CBS 260.36]